MQSSNAAAAAAEKKTLTVTLTGRRPVKIVDADWPVIANGSWAAHDNKYECQANRKWSLWIKVRQHDDGRTLVYGNYHYTTQYQGEDGKDVREGQMLVPTSEEYPAEDRESYYWIGEQIIDAIKAVGESLRKRIGDDSHITEVVAECIAELPAEELT